MFCPKCGQERVSTETSFCSRCGFLLTGAADLLLTGGLIPQITQKAPSRPSPRSRGLKQGLFVFLLSFLVVPLIAIITMALDAEPYAIIISAILLTIGGLLRMAYAVMFESVTTSDPQDLSSYPVAHPLANRSTGIPALPSQHSYPASSYVSPQPGNWRDTNDLQPASVVENTTKLLDSDEIPQ